MFRKKLPFVSCLEYEAGKGQSATLFMNCSATCRSNADPEKKMIFTSSPFIGPPVGKQVDIATRIHLEEEPKQVFSECLKFSTLSFYDFQVLFLQASSINLPIGKS